MDWIRRNWPDLLIGVALVAVIAGIIATLLTGGSFFPLGQSGRNVDFDRNSVQGQARSNDAAGGTASTGATSPFDRAATNPAATNPAVTDPAVTNPAAANPAGAPADSEAPTGTTGIGQAAPNTVQVNPLPLPGTTDSGPTTQSTTQPTNPDAREQEATAPRTEPNAAAAAVGAAAAGPAPTGQVAAGATAQPTDEGSYRISVGAFSSVENAERQANTFRAAGYPVFIGAQGNLSIVLVGPYRDLSEAERVAAAIRSGNFDIEPVIYRYQADAEAASAAAAAAPANPVPNREPEAAATQDATAPEERVVTSGEPRYLQVGAYANSESALPQRERLEALGFRVSDLSEGDLIKLLVGPFAGQELAAARARLNEQGIEHFPR